MCLQGQLNGEQEGNQQFENFMSTYGAVKVGGRTFFKLMQNGEHVLLFPGGAREVGSVSLHGRHVGHSSCPCPACNPPSCRHTLASSCYRRHVPPLGSRTASVIAQRCFQPCPTCASLSLPRSSTPRTPPPAPRPPPCAGVQEPGGAVRAVLAGAGGVCAHGSPLQCPHRALWGCGLRGQLHLPGRCSAAGQLAPCGALPEAQGRQKHPPGQAVCPLSLDFALSTKFNPCLGDWASLFPCVVNRPAAQRRVQSGGLVRSLHRPRDCKGTQPRMSRAVQVSRHVQGHVTSCSEAHPASAEPFRACPPASFCTPVLSRNLRCQGLPSSSTLMPDNAI